MADNGPCIGIEQVHFDGPDALLARADDYSLEDAVTHVLRNAERYRLQESPITITLAAGDTGATIMIHNQIPPIAPEMIGNLRVRCIGQAESGAGGSRGQGQFVAKTYMAKMGDTIAAHNLDGGVSFVMSLQRAG